MTEDEFETARILETRTPRIPFMLGYVVRPMKGDRSAAWSRIGVAWAHRDDKGFDVILDSVPVDGRVVLRTVQQDDPDGAEFVGPPLKDLQ